MTLSQKFNRALNIKRLLKIIFPSLSQFIYFSVFLVCAASYSKAHPVIFKGGLVVDSEQSQAMTDFKTHYTFHPKWATGVHYLKEGLNEFSFARLNHRLLRVNNLESQANVYLGFGLGTERENLKYTRAQLYEIDADWENRDFYFSTMFRQIQRDQHPDLAGRPNLTHQRLRLGLAPYRGDLETLNTWFILQFDQHNTNNWETTPLMRTYYKNILWELGASLNGSYQINLMFHL